MRFAFNLLSTPASLSGRIRADSTNIIPWIARCLLARSNAANRVAFSRTPSHCLPIRVSEGALIATVRDVWACAFRMCLCHCSKTATPSVSTQRALYRHPCMFLGPPTFQDNAHADMPSHERTPKIFYVPSGLGRSSEVAILDSLNAGSGLASSACNIRYGTRMQRSDVHVSYRRIFERARQGNTADTWHGVR
jgi:hypothetical protein